MVLRVDGGCSHPGILPENETSIRELQTGEEESWDAFAKTRPGSNLYHSTLWRDFVRQVFGHRPVYLVAERGGQLTGILPMFLVRAPFLGSKLISLPYDIGSGGTAAIDACSASALLEAAIRRARELRVDYMELRYGAPQPAAATLGLGASEPVIVSDLELGDEKRVWSRLSRNHRRSIHTARESGIQVREAGSLEEYLEFYRIMLRVFRNFGTPPYGPGYIRAVWKHLHPAGAVRLLLAYAGGRPMGGALLFCWGKAMVDKLCLTLPESVPLCANAALYARTIELGLERGFETLNLGSSARTQTGLIEFKEKWGATRRPAVCYALPIEGKVPAIEKYFDSNGLAQRMWRKLPVAVTPLGGVLHRWFC